MAQLGYSALFDEVYATSAAVMNAGYFISNQPFLGISTYFDSCTNGKFINPWRFWKIIDVDYIFDHVAVHEKPLDVKAVLQSPSKLFVAVIDKSNGEGFVVDVQAARTPLLRVLKASAAIPVFYNRAVEIDGRPCMDGGLAIPFALPQALRSGCTDVLVLSTRPADHVCQKPGWFDRLVFNLLCARGNRGLEQVLAQRHLREGEARDLALGTASPAPNANIATICADQGENVHRMTTDRAILHSIAVSYGRKTLRIFGGDADAWSIPVDCAHADAAR